jgi:hypothetical protein
VQKYSTYSKLKYDSTNSNLNGTVYIQPKNIFFEDAWKDLIYSFCKAKVEDTFQ